MHSPIKYQRFVFFFLLILIGCKSTVKFEETKKFTPPVRYEEAGKWADSLVALMTLKEKITLIGGNHIFYTNAIPRLNIPPVMMADATQGIHLRDSFQDYKYEQVLVQSTAFPCPLLLTSTWNVKLAEEYARSIGEECKAGGISVLLGPGMNIYRISQGGRNFEYFGEDPYLAGQMIKNYVIGLQNTGTIATLKHFVANNSDYFRRKSNSVVDERTLHEIYTPAFKAGIDAGAMAVMTSYNLLNGEWCGQSEYVINNLLRRQLGFKWIVMTDWWSVYDGEKVITSGQDLEMPYRIATENAEELVGKNIVEETSIDSMVTHILRTLYAMRSFECKADKELLKKFGEHEKIALQTAREGIVLLRNENNILPIETPGRKILLTGEYIDIIAHGGGAAEVKGYNQVTLAESLKREFGENLKVIKEASDEEIRQADVVILSIGTNDSEGRDRPFDLLPETENRILYVAGINPNVVVVVNSGSGINMTRWLDKVGAILYSWYGGQSGAVAVAEIIAGKVNPSGKLPITIEKDFKDSPGYGYIPQGEQVYSHWNDVEEREKPIFDVVYNEGIFIGYRWYEKKNIEPLFPFGYGLSYTNFKYSNLQVSDDKFIGDDLIEVTFIVTNSGKRRGSEIAQLYIQDFESKLPRPVKELKGFDKVNLKPGETRQISMLLTKRDFSYWNPDIKDWYADPGEFKILIGSSSSEIHLRAEIELQ